MKILSFLYIASLALFFSSTSNATVFIISGSIDPLQAGTNGGFGGGSGSGTGSVSGTYDDSTNLFSYNISWSDLTAGVTNIHFHLGAPGVGGGVALSVPSFDNPLIVNDVLLTGTQETDLLAGNWYVNIHTGGFGGGEIRGQVSATVVPEPSSALFLGLGAFALMLRRRSSRSK